ncbi:hypothetical protein P20652_0422 [Pseudoalteromonas sp. BSi20652]|nr:hypothetical protein P20652_0422 [Pseudoalteromonas sp. BSi20652]
MPLLANYLIPLGSKPVVRDGKTANNMLTLMQIAENKYSNHCKNAKNT